MRSAIGRSSRRARANPEKAATAHRRTGFQLRSDDARATGAVSRSGRPCVSKLLRGMPPKGSRKASSTVTPPTSASEGVVELAAGGVHVLAETQHPDREVVLGHRLRT